VTSSMTRRELLKAGSLISAGSILAPTLPVFGAEPGQAELITRAIPATGERLPVIGLGTNNYSVTSSEDLGVRREVLQHMPKLGGMLIDTAPAYGRSEEVLGELIQQLNNRDQFFVATKATARSGDIEAAKAMIETSFKRLRTQRIELIQVHSLQGIDELMPVLQELKAAKRIKYLGATTSDDAQHAAMAEAMRKYKLDFVQLNYSIDDRESANTLLPLAQDRGTAVLVNLPFGGRRGSNLFARVNARQLPEWAQELDVGSWGQFFLKYVVSHPAVTCTIPGTTKLSHLQDNQRAGRGRLPNAAQRRRMEEYWSGLS
jgi:aryl-alcohol dehydrogenase-like predicted oxidoreductase